MTMRVPFRKMHGLGNDFVVIDARKRPLMPTAAQVSALADRHTGIGFDQLLLLEPPRSEDTHAAYRVFNADGSAAEQCGNGVRCLARLLTADPGLARREIRLQGPATLVLARLEADGRVTASMGEPRFDPAAVPFAAEEEAESYLLEVNGRNLRIGAVSMGNPHAVLAWDTVAEAPVATLGADIAGHSRFPAQTNVEFMQVLDRRHLRLRVFERGAGETSACGSGASAAVAVGRKWGLLDDTVEVTLPGGALEVSWQGSGEPLWLTGPAEDVFGGYIEL